MTNVNVPQASTDLKPAGTPPSSGRRILFFTGLGILVCLGITSIYMPRMVVWYFEPPMPMGVSCSASIRWAIERLQHAQLIAIGVGTVLGFLVGLRFRKPKA